jgi:hypothetical protein
MPRIIQVPELLAIRISEEDKQWLQERSQILKLRPAIYARMLLSKAIENDRRDPGKLLCQ